MRQLGVFAKYWEPGRVKTRLARSLGPERACRIYRELLATTLQRFSAIGDARTVVFSPRERESEFRREVPAGWNLVSQQQGDLGTRMAAWMQSSLEALKAEGADRPVSVLIGADSPTLPVDYVSLAFQMLEYEDLVLGASDDGGYYLIGLACPMPEVFQDIDWGTPRVWEQTMDKLRQLGRNFGQLPHWYDVDQLEDLPRLLEDLKPLSAESAARLAECLEDE